VGRHINGHESVSNKMEMLTGIVHQKCGLVGSGIGTFQFDVSGPHSACEPIRNVV
jgi:hypothetical protein